MDITNIPIPKNIGPDYGLLFTRTFFVIPFLFVLISIFSKIRVWLKLVLLVIAISIFYPVYGVPFLVAAPLPCYLGSYAGGGINGMKHMYRNIFTGTVKEIQSQCIPIGWK